MKQIKRVISLFLPVLMLMTVLTGPTQAALLDVGPNVPPVVGSTPQSPGGLGHGFPLWYRDTNRVPLELCMDEAMCLFVRPNTNQPVRFPTNMPDEVFFYTADASMTVPGGDADLITAIEGVIAVDNGNVTLTTFARVRIRIDTAQAGTYVVTTPFKQYTFENVPVDRRGINFTEDIGIGPNGVFTGALSGSIGPFVYSQGAPFVTSTGSYIGTNTARPVQGSTFIPPGQSQPANYFRVQGPGVDVSTNLFTVTGKIYETVTPTPLTVDSLTYVRDASGVQINTFATTQPVSNQTNPGAAFPLNFALTGALSALEVSGAGIPTHIMATNYPEDGKFFSTTERFDFQGNLPAEAAVTNTADTPPTTKVVPLVDQVEINKADYNPLTKTLSIAAVSYDNVAKPALQAFIAGTDVLLGTLNNNGQLDVTFPVTIGQGQGSKTYNSPPLNVTVKSAKLGSATLTVSVDVPKPVSVTITAPVSGAIFVAGTPIELTATATPLAGALPILVVYSADGATIGLGTVSPYSYSWTTATAGAHSLTAKAYYIDGTTATSAAVPIGVAPSAPILIGPNGNVTTATPVFTWNAVTGANSYTLWNGNSGFSTYTAAAAGCPSGTGICSATLATPLPAGTSVPWAVNATNSSGTSPYNSIMHVRFSSPAIPIAPTLVGPNGTSTNATPVFAWVAVPNADSYRLWNSHSGFSSYTAAAAGCPSGTGICSATLATPLPAGTTVTWAVNTTNTAGTSAYSPTMHALFSNEVIPVAPTLAGPNGNVATATPVFTWNAVANAAKYTLWNAHSGFTTYTPAAAGCPSGTGTCSATLATPLPAGTIVPWAVNAINTAGTSPYSTVMRVKFQ